MKAHILAIGDEILIGQITDTNSAWIAQQLNLQGIELVGTLSVRDTAESILNALHYATPRADLILTTGGLGPTKDDITKKVLADFFGVEMAFYPDVYEHIIGIFARFGKTPNESHRIQSYLPQGTATLYNGMGTAPGMWMEKDGKVYIAMPGVPHEMRYIMTHGALPRLRERFAGKPIAHRTLLTAGIGENDIATIIEAFEDALPAQLKLAYLPSVGQVRLRLTARQADTEDIHTLLDQHAAQLRQLLGRHFYGVENQTLEQVVGELLVARGATVATFESCTGGALAAKMVSVAGASAYFEGSVVAYSNELKIRLLGVNPDTLDRHGAVSEATVKEMLRGGIARLGATYGVAITGIAGPDGGTPEKPVGTVWVAVGDSHHVKTFMVRGTNDREKNIQRTVVYALNFLRKFILDN